MTGQIQLFEDSDLPDGVSASILGAVRDILSSVHDYYPCFSGLKGQDFVKRSWVGENFSKFRGIVWRKHFASMSRDALCSVSIPDWWKESSHYDELALWESELESAWESVLRRFPTFVIYFREGGEFSVDSLHAFTKVLNRMQREEWERGVAAQISLFLSDQKVDDSGACILAGCLQTFCSIVHLDLKDNKISDSGVSALTEALKENETLKVLDLYGSEMTEETLLELIEVLKDNRTLESLTLSTDCVTLKAAKAFEELRKVNPVLEHLDIWR
ncbi:hypothetical protein SCG7109_AJ_00080 [Chlamydiales bacterium SCGC AG-110-M15]|nr:hypothetical protein SCG7109_AJ_00080 [Chlamydiales bacterium SCGC AG-110-M15]